MSDDPSGHSEVRDELLDHEYDGIREYDNPLPGWWKGIFWASFWFALVYVGWYHSRDDRGVHAEYEVEMQAFYEKQTAELLAMGQIDEVLLATLMKNTNALKQARGNFLKTCVTCHKADGSGDIGPNLTDGHWLGGNTLMDIYTTIKDGRNKMPAWGNKMAPIEVLQLAAYVGSILYTNVEGGKAPEGKPLPPAPVPDTRDAGAGGEEDTPPPEEAPSP